MNMLHEKSCGAIVYRKFHGNTEILLIKHINSGHWSFPKGHVEKGETEGGMLIINDTLAFIRDNAEQEILVSALLKKLLIDTAEKENLSFIDLETENRRLLQLAPDGKLKRFGIG